MFELTKIPCGLVPKKLWLVKVVAIEFQVVVKQNFGWLYESVKTRNKSSNGLMKLQIGKLLNGELSKTRIVRTESEKEK